MKIEAHLLRNNNSRISILMGPEIKYDIANMSKTERDAFSKDILAGIELVFKRLDMVPIDTPSDIACEFVNSERPEFYNFRQTLNDITTSPVSVLLKREFDWSIRARHVLETCVNNPDWEIVTINDLLQMGVMRIPNAGRKTLNEIKQVLLEEYHIPIDRFPKYKW